MVVEVVDFLKEKICFLAGDEEGSAQALECKVRFGFLLLLL
jgi:hypothetical protein